ncbi:MAG: 3-deoxy-D-manno-octulosonic acid transferase [Verrucomicrobiaceae bacterium]
MAGLVRFFYNLVLPVVCLVAAPFWLVKMIRRGGWGTGLLERVGIYGRDAEFEKQGAVYVHAVSVGETLLALKLIEAWREVSEDHFILVPTTATGMAVAREKAPEGVRVIYAPVDFSFLIRRVLKRFAPRVIVLIESELWPNLLHEAQRAGVPIGLANARLSPRSAKRLESLSGITKSLIGQLDVIGVPEEADVERWERLGAREGVVQVTGNVKFDAKGAGVPMKREEFAAMIGAFGVGRKVVMAVSTFAGEEEWLAEAFLNAGEDVLPVIVPRHAERRDEVVEAIERVTGCGVVLRSKFREPDAGDVFVIDSTGELRDWTAHAEVVVIGKSFFNKGGQNPGEAILAGIPVICGPEMSNFEPLVSELRSAGGIQMVESQEEVTEAVRRALAGAGEQVESAAATLRKHEGSVGRTIALFAVVEGESAL